MREAVYLYVTGLPLAMVESRLIPLLREDRAVLSIALLQQSSGKGPVVRVGVAAEGGAPARIEQRVVTNFTGIRTAGSLAQGVARRRFPPPALLLYARPPDGGALLPVAPGRRTR